MFDALPECMLSKSTHTLLVYVSGGVPRLRPLATCFMVIQATVKLVNVLHVCDVSVATDRTIVLD